VINKKKKKKMVKMGTGAPPSRLQQLAGTQGRVEKVCKPLMGINKGYCLDSDGDFYFQACT
jgi:hypothetical protein